MSWGLISMDAPNGVAQLRLVPGPGPDQTQGPMSAPPSVHATVAASTRSNSARRSGVTRASSSRGSATQKTVPGSAGSACKTLKPLAEVSETVRNCPMSPNGNSNDISRDFTRRSGERLAARGPRQNSILSESFDPY